MNRAPRQPSQGPFNVDQIRPGDPYELSDGHAIYCAPTGGDGARGPLVGGHVLDTDPDVESAGLDAGFALDAKTMRAPDIAVGNVPDAPGWIKGAVPRLAVEYASVGQDEPELQRKIEQLLAAGTQLIWVVRLLGPRRVEIYEAARPVRIAHPGEELIAAGILRNAVPVEALFDRDKAHELTLRNLLQRRGYESLDGVLEEGREEGREELRLALHDILGARGLPLSESQRSRIDACKDIATLRTWITRAATARTGAEVLES